MTKKTKPTTITESNDWKLLALWLLELHTKHKHELEKEQEDEEEQNDDWENNWCDDCTEENCDGCENA